MTTSALGVMCLMGWSGAAHAQEASVSLQFDEQLATKLGLDTSAMEAELSDQIDEGLRVVDQGDFLAGMANATSISTRGMGVDYASDFQRAVIGGSFGTAVAGRAGFGRGDTPLPVGGFSAQVSLMAGLNLGFASSKDSFARRVRVFVNGMAMTLPSGSPFDGSFENYGAHLQLELIDGVSATVAEWGGLALTGGYQRTNYHLELQEELPIDAEAGVPLTWNADGTYQVDAWANTIPLEVSTSFRVFVISGYMGVGYDLTTAGAESEATLQGDIDARVDDDKRRLGTGTVSLLDEAPGDDAVGRAFVGAQVNVLLVKAYGQLNIGFNETFGGNVGLRVAW